MLGFTATATLPPPPAPPATTVIQSNTTTIVFSSTTTYISGISTGVVYPAEDASYSVAVFAFVQDAVTGQNVTTSSSQDYFGGGCSIQQFGYSECVVPGAVPPGHTYKVSVYVTKGELPCSLGPSNIPGFVCTSQLLAPVRTMVVSS